jgi:predicted anti-sigma-YlaC factor YlaD
MHEVHPSEVDLARLSELDGGGEGISAEIAEHLRWCADCRSIVADHRWLQDEIVAALAAAADSVPLPRPQWRAVQEVLVSSQRRQVAGWRGSAVASVVVAVCLMLSLSRVLGTVGVMAQTAASPEAVVATAPDVDEGYLLSAPASLATPTPVIFRAAREIAPPPTPGLVLPPTPTQPEI